MSKRRRVTTAETIKQREREGRGQGEGKNYKPYLNIQDVPSTGFRPRIMGIKTGRMHQYMSKFEENYHNLLEAAPTVIDIREQWPMDLQRTQLIAIHMGIAHPKDSRSQHPIVMTTDFFITRNTESGNVYIARTVKPSDAFDKRTCEKLEIERLYYQMLGIDWGIVTENEIPISIADNFDKLSPYLSLENYDLTDQDVQQVEVTLYPRLIERTQPLRKLTAWCDKELGFSSNKSLTATYHLIASGKWIVDFCSPVDSTKVLHLIEKRP
jgi:hypothetical protein